MRNFYNISFANILTITPIGSSSYERSSGDSTNVNYTLKITNVSGVTYSLIKQQEKTTSSLPLTLYSTTCHFDGKTTLSSGSSCLVEYTATVPTVNSKKTYSALIGVDTTLGYEFKSESLSLSVSPGNALGHLEFQKNSATITSASLGEGESGSLILKNTGKNNISSLQLTIPTALSGVFTGGDCLTKKVLSTTSPICTLNYNVTSLPSNPSYTVMGSGADNSPLSLSVKFHSNDAVYVLTSSSIQRCTIKSDGTFNTCSVVTATTSSGSGVGGSLVDIDFSLDGNNVYLTNFSNGSNNLYHCSVTNTGQSFSNCTVFVPQMQPIPYYLNGSAIDPLGRHLYFSQINNIYYCDLDSTTGAASNCQMGQFSGPTVPQKLTFNHSTTNLGIYVASGGGSSSEPVDFCTIKADGSGNICADAWTFGSNSPYDVAVNPTGTVAYVTQSNKTEVNYCLINSSNGLFTSCTAVNPGNIFTSTGNKSMVMPNSGNGIYITNGQNVVHCTVDSSTDALSACKTANTAAFSGTLSAIAFLE